MRSSAKRSNPWPQFGRCRDSRVSGTHPSLARSKPVFVALGSSTTAPAPSPSPNRTADSRRLQSISHEVRSAPITKARSIEPARIMSVATLRP